MPWLYGLKTIKNQKEKQSDITDGFTIKYHAYGKTIWSKGEIIEGQSDGYWEWYRIDGKLKLSGYFQKGETFSEWTTYDHEGKVNKVTKNELPTVHNSPNVPPSHSVSAACTCSSCR